MIDFILVSFLNGYTYVRRHPELLMTLLLVVVIPIAFLFSGQQFLNAAKENQESLEKNRIGIIHDILPSFLNANHFEQKIIQEELEEIAHKNTDITQFIIAKEEKDNLLIVASLDTQLISTSVIDPDVYKIGDSIIIPSVHDGIRYWKSYKSVKDSDGNQYYIYIETSLEKLDALLASRIKTAYYWLLGILTIVLLLIFRHVRLIDYAYLYNQTKKANEMKDLFTNMVAHELRAPLTAIRGYASLIREDKTVEVRIHEQASKIEDSSERLVLIVNDLLDVARIHSGKLSIKNERINVQKVITSVVNVMQAVAAEKNIVLKLENEIPDIYIQADEKRMYQALTNLVSNSLKYTQAGTILVSLQNLSDRIEIRVKDTGMGISAENQKHLFAPFFRVENTETDNVLGTGLGMWITKQLIELMKGSIEVESIRGVGTHIVITLPKE